MGERLWLVGQDATMTDDAVTTLQRWTDSGAHWRVLARSGDSVTVALLQCDGGQEVDRLTSSSTELLAYIGGRSTDLD